MNFYFHSLHLKSDFDQNEFYDNNDANGHGLDDKGYIYIPKRYKTSIRVTLIFTNKYITILDAWTMEQVVIYMFTFMVVDR